MRQLAADRRTIALILFVPLMVISVAGVLVRSEGGSLRVAVVLQDSGTRLPLSVQTVNLGERLTSVLGEGMSNVQVIKVAAAEANMRLTRAEIDAVITFPPNFSEQTMSTRGITLPVQFEGSNPMAARLLEGLVGRAAIQTIAGLGLLSTGGASLPSITLDATYRYGGAQFDTMDYLAPVFIGLFAFMFVFILTSVSFLRERSGATLERLQSTPISRAEIIVGYMFGFALFALAQSLIILGYTVFGLQIHYKGSLLVVFLVELMLALMAVNLGIFFSAFARNEFQIVQFIPLVVVTQVLLSGALWAIKDMPGWLQPIAWIQPLTYANQALRDVMIRGYGVIEILPQLGVLALFVVVLIALSAQMVRRSV
jgi:ABC-2 type transport system permease protein